MKYYYLTNYKNKELIKTKYNLLLKHVDYILSIAKPFIKKIHLNRYEIELYVRTPLEGARLIYLLAHNTNCKYENLTDLAVIDYPNKANRFEINYLLLSTHYNNRVKVISETDGIIPAMSAWGTHTSCLWLEREAWDMFGIFFLYHPDLRRILTDYGFEGHPLRKDFPLTGYVEVFYDDSKKRIVYEPVSLAQEFRNFDFVNPW